MSAYPGPAAVAAASEILEAAGYHPHKSTIVNALRAADSAATFDRRNESARPVEEREPVGPYAPTRTGVPLSLAESAVLSALSDLIVNQSNRLNTGLASLGNRFDGLGDVVLGLGRQMTDNRVWASERFDRIDTALTKLTDLFVDSRDEIERTMTRPEYLRWKEGFDFGIKGFAEEMATARRETREAFERGRQQGDADRAQRGQTEFERGKTVGAAERESELLDQGWTPPGAIVLRMDPELSDARLWIKAVAIAGSQRDRRQLDPERVRADAVWFYGELKTGPEPASYLVDQEREQTRVTEHEAAADLPAKEIPGAEADYPF